MEYWDVYDADRRLTGRRIRRGEKLEKGEYHLSVHVLIRRGDGKLLLQRRAADKADWPGVWDISAAGSALAGEGSREAAARELREELGIELFFSEAAPRLMLSLKDCFGDWYLMETEMALPIVLQREEVADAGWFTREELEEMLADGRMVDYNPGLFSLLLDNEPGMGAMRSWRGRWK